LRRSRIKTLNRWMLPFIVLAVVAFTIFPSQVLLLLGGKAPAEVRAGENETLVTISVRGMT